MTDAVVDVVLAVEVDAAELGRDLCNLVVNAIRLTPADGSVEILAEAEEGMAWVAVSDACGGIPDEDLLRGST